jgi:hypothetical protein
MAIRFGTNMILDTLGVLDKANVNILEYGIDNMWTHLEDLRTIHNNFTEDIFSTFMARTTEKIHRLGVDAVEGSMQEVSEDGLADVQKVAVTGYDIGLPLRMYQYGRQWTTRYLQKATVQELGAQIIAAQTADIKNLRAEAMKALFRATNYTFVDRLDNYQDVPVKALINADSSPIPRDPFGATFNGATHTHYLARAGGAVVAAGIQGLINTLVEHDVKGGQIVLYINKAQEAAVRAFTSNFEPLLPPLFQQAPGSTNDGILGDPRIDPYVIDDRIIGVWDSFVWVRTKPWVPANYYLAVIEGGSNEPVLMMREDEIASLRGFRSIGQDGVHPIFHNHFERECGFGVWNRLGAAILYGGNTVYAVPVFTN